MGHSVPRELVDAVREIVLPEDATVHTISHVDKVPTPDDYPNRYMCKVSFGNAPEYRHVLVECGGGHVWHPATAHEVINKARLLREYADSFQGV